MVFWVPNSDFKIGVERRDVEEYIKKVRNKELPVTPGKDLQKSFAYFIKDKMKLPYYQDAEIEIGFKSYKVAQKVLSKTDNQAPSIDTTQAVNLEGLDISGMDFEGITFNSTDLKKVNFENTFLFNSRFLNTDLKSTNIEESISNEHTNFSDSALEEKQRSELDSKIEFSKTVVNVEVDSKRVTESIDSPGSLEYAKRVAKAFFGTLLDPAGDDYRRSIDEAFDVLRYNYFKTKDEKLLEQVEETGKGYLKNRIDSILNERGLTKSKLSTWIGASIQDSYTTELRESISNEVIKNLGKNGFLKNDFYPQMSKIEDTLRDVLDEKFITNLKNLVKKLPQKQEKGAGEVEKFKNTTVSYIARHLHSKTEKLQESKTASEERIKHLKTLSTRKKFKNVNTNSSQEGFLSKTVSMDWCSTTKPSSYPSLNPYDNETIVKDLTLKREGAQFLIDMASLGAGLSVASLLGTLVLGKSVRNVASGSLGIIETATGIIAGLAANKIGGELIDRKMTYENYKKLDNQLGDRLLEFGVLKRSMAPYIKTLGLDSINRIMLNYLKSSGPLGAGLAKYQGLTTSIAVYGAYSDFLTTQEYIKKHRESKNPLKRERPGSKTFDKNLKYKLFNQQKFFISVLAPALLITAAVIIATSFPAAIPFLSAFAAKATALEIGAVAMGAFAATSGATYVTYSAVTRGAGYFTSIFKQKAHEEKYVEQSKEAIEAQEKAAATIQKAFSNYKYKKTEKTRSTIKEAVKNKEKILARDALVKEIKSKGHAERLKKSRSGARKSARRHK